MQSRRGHPRRVVNLLGAVLQGRNEECWYLKRFSTENMLTWIISLHSGYYTFLHMNIDFKGKVIAL